MPPDNSYYGFGSLSLETPLGIPSPLLSLPTPEMIDESPCGEVIISPLKGSDVLSQTGYQRETAGVSRNALVLRLPQKGVCFRFPSSGRETDGLTS